MSASLRKGWCPGVLRPMPAKDGLLVRLRITGGILATGQAHALANLAEHCGNGLIDLSGRGNLQMRGVGETTLGRLQEGLVALGLLDANAAEESVRNVVASPLAGLHDGLDVRPLVSDLEARLVADASLHALPPKFGFLVDDGSDPSLSTLEADVRFDWDGKDFVVGIGGDRAGAVPVARCAANKLVGEAVRIARTFLECRAITPDVRRMRQLGGAVLRNAFRDPPGSTDTEANPGQVRDKLFSRKPEAEGARDIVGLRAYAATHRREMITPVLGLAAPFGRLDAAMLRAAAELANETALGELRLTPWRVILVPGVREAVDVPGFISDPSDQRLFVAACVGNAGCHRATTNVPADAAGLASVLRSSADIALHVSGCAKGCGRSSPTAVTLVGRDGRYDIVRDGRASDPPWRQSLDLAAARDALQALA